MAGCHARFRRAAGRADAPLSGRIARRPHHLVSLEEALSELRGVLHVRRRCTRRDYELLLVASVPYARDLFAVAERESADKTVSVTLGDYIKQILARAGELPGDGRAAIVAVHRLESVFECNADLKYGR